MVGFMWVRKLPGLASSDRESYTDRPRGFRAWLEGVVDYAGLFPPAELPLDQAVGKYARYRQEPESWMLGRFVCPAGRLAELDPFLDKYFRVGPPLAISVLGRGAATFGEF